jgi:hypothetical protein
MKNKKKVIQSEYNKNWRHQARGENGRTKPKEQNTKIVHFQSVLILMTSTRVKRVRVIKATE